MNLLREFSIEATQVILTVAVIVFFAIVHATSQLKIHKDKQMEFDYIDFIILFIIGCGAGGLFGLGALWVWGNNFVAVILMSAVGAVSGMVGLNRFASLMLDLLTNMTKRK